MINSVQFSVNCNKDRVFANRKTTDVFAKQFQWYSRGKQFIKIAAIKNGKRGIGTSSTGDSFQDFEIKGIETW